MTSIKRHVLPGETGGDTTWFSRQNPFEQQVILRQVAFKRRHWPDLENGRFSKRPNYAYPHILPAGHEHLAFYESLAEPILTYLAESDIALHTEALNLKSSQVACLNILFPLRMDLDFAAAVLKPFFEDLDAATGIEFEYTGPPDATEWMGEPRSGKRGQNRTSIDAAIFWVNTGGHQHATLVEWKYTERGFGKCSAFQSGSKDDKAQCRAMDVAKDLQPGSACLLTTGKRRRSRRYWEHIQRAGIALEAFVGVDGCPFQGPFYQLMRQFLLASYLQVSGLADQSDVLSLGFSGNTALSQIPRQLRQMAPTQNTTILGAWNTVLKGVPPMQHLTVEALTSSINQAGSFIPGWWDYLRERYGV
jgi:hypothetical protein